MWSIAGDDNQALSVNYGDSVFFRLKGLEVTLDDGQVIYPELEGGGNLPLDLSEQMCCRRFCYKDEVEVDIWLREDCQHLILGVTARIKKGISWPYATFHPVNAVKLILDPGEVTGLCAHYLYNSWWTRPHFNQHLAQLPKRAQSLLLARQSMPYSHLLAFCDSQVKGEFQGNEKGVALLASPQKAGIRFFSGAVAIMGCSDNPYQLMLDSVVAGRRQLPFYSKSREERVVPAIFDYLGWCSWDACYLDVNEQAVLAKAEEFKEKGIPVKWMLVDDGWSEEQDRKLMSFQENKEKFPSGFKGVKEVLKHQYDIPWLGAWHALTGQWEGVDRQARLPEVIKNDLEVIDEHRALPPSEPVRALRFWQNWHDYLSRQGVDFVKVDVQSNLANHYCYQAFPGELSQSVHQALENSVGLYFEGGMINCMGMATEQLWNRPVSALSRNSDDFFPNQPGNIREHALQNAYNALYHDGFYQGDWDMWWSEHDDAESHALLRVFSGGPIYTSDPLGKTNANQLKRLVLADGRVIRCYLQGKATRDCLFENPVNSSKPLTIWNRIGPVGVLASFHISECCGVMETSVTASQLEGFEGECFVAVAPAIKKAVRVKRDDPFSFSLHPLASECILFYPDCELFCIGLADKLLPSFVIEEQKWQEGGLRARLSQGGVIWLYSTKAISSIYVDGQKVNWNQSDNIIEFEYRSDKSVEVNVRLATDHQLM